MENGCYREGGKDGEGGEGRGNVVCSPGQRIGLAFGRSLAVDDGVSVGCEGSRPPGVRML